ncbi:hypothetical protein Emed_001682 [Eimeria media]
MFTYKFSNLLAAPYSCSQAHLSFDRKGSSLYAPSSNRVCRYSLTAATRSSNNSSNSSNKIKSSSSSKSAFDSIVTEQDEAATDGSSKVTTLPFEGRVDVSHFCLRSDGLLAISIDVHGLGLVINLVRGNILNRVKFRSNTSSARLKWEAERNQHFVAAASFSPDDTLFAVACGRTVQLWHSPRRSTNYQLHLLHAFALHQQPITCLSWSPDSLHLVSGSQDCTVRLWRARGKWALSNAAAAAAAELQKIWGGDQATKESEGKEEGVEQSKGRQQTPEEVYRQRVDDAFVPSAFLSHRHEVKFVCFSTCLRRIYSVNREGVIIVWAWQTEAEAEEEQGEEGIPKRNSARPINPGYFQQRREKQRQKKQQSGETKDTAADVQTEAEAVRPPDEVINYAEGLWHMEQRAFCNQEKGQRVSHATTNTSPFYRYTASPSPSKAVHTLDSAIRPAGHGGAAPPQYLLVGFTGGVFQLYTLPHLDAIVKLSLGVTSLDSVCLSYDGEWIAAAAAESNTLVVWEWRSETYVLRQQAHRHGVRCVAFSPAADAAAAGNSRIGAKAGSGGAAQQRSVSGVADAASSFGLGVSRGIVATGSNEGRVKVWDAESGFCYCTFADHTAAVSDVCFSPTGNALFSASLDGTVRAYDLLRFKPFRVLTARSATSAATGFAGVGNKVDLLFDSSVQFTCVATDAGGELVVAGSQGSCFSAFVWSVRTAKLLEELSGHEAPVVAVAFHPHPDKQGLLATGSWDKKVKVWDIFGRRRRGGAPETLLQTGGVMCLAFDPKGRDLLAVGGERVMGLTAGLDFNACITSLSFSSTGSLLLASSRNCPKVLLYETESGVLVGSFLLTSNRLLEGIARELNSKYIADDGTAIQEYDLSDVDDDLNEGERERKRIRNHRALPGVTIGELASKNDKVFLVHDVSFSSDSRCFAAATSHGLYIFSIDLNRGMLGSYGTSDVGHAPPLMTKNVTTGNIALALSKEEYAKAFLLALVCNDLPTLLCVYEKIPPASVPLVCSSLAPSLLPPLLFFLQTMLSTDVQVGTRHLQFHLLWLSCLLKLHMHVFQGDLANYWAASLDTETKTAEQEEKEDEKARRAEAFSRLSRASVDMRTLFLMTLRQLQQHHFNLHASYASNVGTLAFLTSAIQNNRRSSVESIAAHKICSQQQQQHQQQQQQQQQHQQQQDQQQHLTHNPMYMWLGIKWDEGPDIGGPSGFYRQSERLSIYRHHGRALLERNVLYKCFCTKERLARLRQERTQQGLPPRIPSAPDTISFRDGLRGLVTFSLQQTLGDFVCFRPANQELTQSAACTEKPQAGAGGSYSSSFAIESREDDKAFGTPVYNFCAAVDDWLMGVTAVVRGEEHIPNTIAQILLARALRAPILRFCHLPVMLAKEGGKISKRKQISHHALETTSLSFRDRQSLFCDTSSATTAGSKVAAGEVASSSTLTDYTIQGLRRRGYHPEAVLVKSNDTEPLVRFFCNVLSLAPEVCESTPLGSKTSAALPPGINEDSIAIVREEQPCLFEFMSLAARLLLPQHVAPSAVARELVENLRGNVKPGGDAFKHLLQTTDSEAQQFRLVAAALVASKDVFEANKEDRNECSSGLANENREVREERLNLVRLEGGVVMTFEAWIEQLSKQLNMEKPTFLRLARLALTGRDVGVPLGKLVSPVRRAKEYNTDRRTTILQE